MSRFTRAGSLPASVIVANSARPILMTPSVVLIGSGNGLFVRPGPDGTYGPRPGNPPWRPPPGGPAGGAAGGVCASAGAATRRAATTRRVTFVIVWGYSDT